MKTLAFLLLIPVLSLAAARPAAKPNIVWLVSEDNSSHYLKLFDPNGAPTPNIEAMAKHGLVFEHAFSNAPVCSTARTTLATGCYGPRIGTQYHRRSKMAPMPEGLHMFPYYLKQAGYYTTNKKKDYNAVEGKGVWDGAADWHNREDGQPFFHMESNALSHEGSLHFPASEMKKATKTDPAKVFIAPYHPDTPTFRYTYARYHDRIMAIDEWVGNIVAELEADGLLEDTFIFYFGDHGGVLPRGKGYAYESGLHVPLVVRVPEHFKHLVDAKRGTRMKGFVSFIDFGPTALRLAGVNIPAQVDGKPFLGKGISGAEVNARDEAFGYADRFDEKYDLVRTLRKGKYSYIRSYQPFNFDGLQNNYRYKMLAYQEWRTLYKAGKLNAAQGQFFEPRAPEALYDLSTDPHEVNNLAGDPAHAKVLKNLRERLSAKVKSINDLSMYPEPVMTAEAFDNPVAFGEKQRAHIARLVDIADLQLLPFGKARSGIEAALASGNAWERYWGLITCSSHGKAALPLKDKVAAIAANDAEALVRVRAAEFLGLTCAGDPRPILLKALGQAKSGPEGNLMLNSLVMLQDGKPGYAFGLKKEHLPPEVAKYGDVQRRLSYLVAGETFKKGGNNKKTKN